MHLPDEGTASNKRLIMLYLYDNYYFIAQIEVGNLESCAGAYLNYPPHPESSSYGSKLKIKHDHSIIIAISGQGSWLN